MFLAITRRCARYSGNCRDLYNRAVLPQFVHRRDDLFVLLMALDVGEEKVFPRFAPRRATLDFPQIDFQIVERAER